MRQTLLFQTAMKTKPTEYGLLNIQSIDLNICMVFFLFFLIFNINLLKNIKNIFLIFFYTKYTFNELFESVFKVAFQNVFYLKIYQNNIFFSF
jgi:hypothetical protein